MIISGSSEPLYRQSEIFARQGIELSRALLSNWVDACCQLMTPLNDALYRYVMNTRKVHTDDTPVKVLAPGRKKAKTGRIWTYVRDDRNAGSSEPPAVWFAYSPDRQGKHLIQVHFIDEGTGEVIDKQLRSRDFLEYFRNRKSCLIGMEACGESQHWVRELAKLGHKVRLLQTRFVRAFVMGNKNDVMDARTIWMTVQQPGKEIAVKTEEQQSLLILYRSCRQSVE